MNDQMLSALENTTDWHFSMFVSHKVHLLVVSPEVTSDDVIANYLWIGRPEGM